MNIVDIIEQMVDSKNAVDLLENYQIAQQALKELFSEISENFN